MTTPGPELDHPHPGRPPFAIPDGLANHLARLWATGQAVPELFHDYAVRLADTPHGEPAPHGTTNPYWDIVRQLPCDRGIRHPPTVNTMPYLNYPIFRDHLTITYAYAIPSPADITFLADQLDHQSVIELGAGTGYWAWQLSQAGIDVTAYDDHSWRGWNGTGTAEYHPVAVGSVEKLSQHTDRVLMLCWPPPGTPFAADALTAYTGNTLIYIGESPGRINGDDRFDDIMANDWTAIADSPGHINFTGIHSSVTIYKRCTSAH